MCRPLRGLCDRILLQLDVSSDLLVDDILPAFVLDVLVLSVELVNAQFANDGAGKDAGQLGGQFSAVLSVAGGVEHGNQRIEVGLVEVERIIEVLHVGGQFFVALAAGQDLHVARFVPGEGDNIGDNARLAGAGEGAGQDFLGVEVLVAILGVMTAFDAVANQVAALLRVDVVPQLQDSVHGAALFSSHGDGDAGVLNAGTGLDAAGAVFIIGGGSNAQESSVGVAAVQQNSSGQVGTLGIVEGAGGNAGIQHGLVGIAAGSEFLIQDAVVVQVDHGLQVGLEVGMLEQGNQIAFEIAGKVVVVHAHVKPVGQLEHVVGVVLNQGDFVVGVAVAVGVVIANPLPVSHPVSPGLGSFHAGVLGPVSAIQEGHGGRKVNTWYKSLFIAFVSKNGI